MGVLAFLIGVAVLPALSEAAAAIEDAEICEEYLAVHKILSQPDNIYRFSDDREMRADVYSVGGCSSFSKFPTGGMFTGNYSYLSHSAEYGNDECLVKNDEYNSFQVRKIPRR